MKKIKIGKVTYQLLEKNTKKAQNYISNFNHSDTMFLWECYNHYSIAKQQIFDYYFEEWEKNNNIENYRLNKFKIITYNTFIFTIGYLLKDSVTNQIHLAIITPNYNYLIENIYS